MLHMFEEYVGIRGKDRKQILEAQFELLRHRYKIICNLKRALLFIGVALLVVSPIIYIVYTKLALACWFIPYGLLSLVGSYLIPSRELATELRDIDNELDYIKIAEKSTSAARAEKKFKLHQIELKKYYDQTLRHSTWIFFVGLGCLFLGFVIIGGTIYIIASDSLGNGNRAQVILGILGAIGGFLSNYVAAIYLKMYAQTIGSLTEFHNRLVMTHHLHFANFIASKITNKALLNKTLAEFALKLTTK